ncbi:MAG: hypothetical protein HZA27_01235 [Candidatus Omnitrophica bacterium]|nr:hypothetical protein [Candidatus Omnitrophota bacterium]
MDNKSDQAPETITLDSGTERLLKKIQDENIKIDPTVWDLLTHVIGNRTYAINLTLGDFMDTPKWIMNTVSYLMMFLYKISGGRGSLHPVPYYIQRTLKNTAMLKEFLNRLREVTKEKREF